MNRTAPPEHEAESPIHSLELVASPDEIDELNHVSNLVYLRWVLRAAMAHSTAAGYDYRAYRELGAVFVVRRHEIDYLAPAFAGDRVTITTWIESWRGASSVRRTNLTRDPDGVLLARATTLWALVSTDGGRPTRIPPSLIESFRRAV